MQYECSFNVVSTFEDFQEKQHEQEQKDKVNNQLKRPPKSVESIIGVIYRRFTDKEVAVSPIELMKEAKLYKKSVEKKKDLTTAEENIYLTVNRKIKEFIAAGHVIEIQY